MFSPPAMERTSPRSCTRLRIVTPVVVALCVCVLSACQDPLYITGEPRSQYDKNAAIRDRRAPDYIYDEFGARRPNIRGRLLGAE